MTFPFLSDQWIDAAREIRERYAEETPDFGADITINLVVVDVPFDDDTVRAVFDTSSGSLQLELGERDNADATVTTDYDTARMIFVEQDQAMAMQAFMEGKVKVQGDMMKMMAMQAALGAPDSAADIANEIRSITA